jgi:hypothetical protein
MVPVLIGAGLVLVLLVAIYLRRRSTPLQPAAIDPRAVDALRRRLSWPKPRPVLPAVRAIPSPMPWERAYWRRAPKNGGPRG